MDSKTNQPDNKPVTFANGIYVRGVVVSNRAKAFNRKDGSGVSVVVEAEIALQPGVAVFQRYFDPKKDTGLRLDGENVVEFPRLKEFQTVTIKAARVRSDEQSGQLFIKGGELIA